MDISATVEFTADPEAVYTMMTDQAYLEEVCVASQSRDYEVSVTGSTTKTSRSLAAPATAAKFTGPELVVVEQTTWGEPGPDSSRTAAVKMTVTGQPVTMNGSIRLVPAGPGSVVTLTGVLKVAIPFIGKKMEESAAPAVLAGFRTQQKVGERWLTARR